MNLSNKLSFLFFWIFLALNAQNDTIKLKEVEVTSNRITIPFSKISKTIKIISSDDIAKSGATNIADLLQNIAGIDIRRRGVEGMQSDLYIRGGNFDQTLLLIDGVKMDDAQTGHHTMNAIISLENIERIEIIKGPSARIYGQNAFTGAVNIITKKVNDNALQLDLKYGSYKNKKGEIAFHQNFNKGNVLASFSYQEADGYRYNTDFSTISSFIKTEINSYTLTSSFNERKFGANGFYASPDYHEQYEETQTSLLALGTVKQFGNIELKPRFYWRRNQDMYVFVRSNPSYYRNLHISNKVGFETNMSIDSEAGKTGLGFDVSRVFLSSNNLGNHNRTAIVGFLEHRFEFFDQKFDITPGVTLNYYSDFDTKIYPGLDAGYRFSEKIKLYGNIGYTYRVPTYTDLYYVGPTTLGNPDLEPESALSEELGLVFTSKNIQFNFAGFNRKSDNLIDWTKDNEEDKWETRNFSKVVSKGFEFSSTYQFFISNKPQKLHLGYTFIDDAIKDENVTFTRYSLNSLKHQLSLGISTKFLELLSNQFDFRYVERTDGTCYNVVDANLLVDLSESLKISIKANNVFNTTYTETNLVPMPKGNVMIGVKYKVY